MELKNVEIIKIGELKTFASGFQTLEYIVKDDNSQYPQEYQIQAVKEKAEEFLKYNKVGQRVDISFNLLGRSWLKDGQPESERKWFNTLQSWKVFKVGVNEVDAYKEKRAPQAPDSFEDDDQDDLPF